jgi:hypothetical protein
MKPKVRVRVQFGQPPAAKPAAVASPAPEAPRVTRVARLLALAWWLDEEIRAGRIKNLAEAARELGLTRARVTQVMNLRLLAPAIQEALMLGAASRGRGLRTVTNEPDWAGQAARVYPARSAGMAAGAPLSSQPVR